MPNRAGKRSNRKYLSICSCRVSINYQFQWHLNLTPPLLVHGHRGKGVALVPPDRRHDGGRDGEGRAAELPPDRDAGPETLERYFRSVLVTRPGGFRIEDVVRSLNPNVEMHGDEMTLVPSAAGRLLMGRDHAGIEFAASRSALHKAGSACLRIRYSFSKSRASWRHSTFRTAA